jgi:glucose-1-phosphate cytidylyltransferase
MKVVLFCGGMGTRLREYSDHVPKPLVPIGYRPVLWHVMKYYAHFGHRDFILCLGYKGDKIKEYFLKYEEWVSNDFTMSAGGQRIDLRRSDIQDWNITFVDTGLSSNIGTRLQKVAAYLQGEQYFLANYTDGLTDHHLPTMIDAFRASGKVGAFLCAPPSQTFHVVTLGEHNAVRDIRYVRETNILVNCGFFVFRSDIFDYMRPQEELVINPFRRLIDTNQLMAFQSDRFFAMDTFKEQQQLTDLYTSGEAPWEVWRDSGATPAASRERRPAASVDLQQPVALVDTPARFAFEPI